MALPLNTRVFILLGSNLGDPRHNLLVARTRVEITVGKIVKSSSLYRTAAWGKTDQPVFLNQVIEVETALNAHGVLHALMQIEREEGRERTQHWGPRIIDLDILYYGDEVIEREDLTVPHPGIALRRFTLVPLNEIAPDFRHPILKKTTKELLKDCPDKLEVTKLD